MDTYIINYFLMHPHCIINNNPNNLNKIEFLNKKEKKV